VTPFTLSQILETPLAQGEVEVPEWGGTVKVRAITSAELSRARREATNPRTKDVDSITLACAIVGIGCVEPEFMPGQYKALLNVPFGPIERVSNAILDLTGLSELGEAEAGTDE